MIFFALEWISHSIANYVKSLATVNDKSSVVQIKVSWFPGRFEGKLLRFYFCHYQLSVYWK